MPLAMPHRRNSVRPQLRQLRRSGRCRWRRPARHTAPMVAQHRSRGALLRRPAVRRGEGGESGGLTAEAEGGGAAGAAAPPNVPEFLTEHIHETVLAGGLVAGVRNHGGHRGVNSIEELLAARAAEIKRPRLHQMFEHALVDRPGFHSHDESSNPAKGPWASRSAMIFCAASSPTPFTPASPKRMAPPGGGMTNDK